MSSQAIKKAVAALVLAIVITGGISILVDFLTAGGGSMTQVERPPSSQPAEKALVPEEAPAEAAPAPAAVEGDAEAGAAIAKRKCGACHHMVAGAGKKLGPNLFGVVGRGIGSEDFKYSDALGSHGGTWTPEALDGFLAKPQDYIPGTRMSFVGLKNAEDRAALIAFLATLSE